MYTFTEEAEYACPPMRIHTYVRTYIDTSVGFHPAGRAAPEGLLYILGP
jgi:hypothetical protein